MNIKQTLYFKLNRCLKFCIKMAVALPLLVSCNSSKTSDESKSLMDSLQSIPPEETKKINVSEWEEEVKFVMVTDEGEYVEIKGVKEIVREYVNAEGVHEVEILVRTPDEQLIKVKSSQIASYKEEQKEMKKEDVVLNLEVPTEVKPYAVNSAEQAIIPSFHESPTSPSTSLSRGVANLANDPDAHLVPQYIPQDPEIQNILNEHFKEEVIVQSENINDIKISRNDYAFYNLRRAESYEFEEQYNSIGKVLGAIGDEILIKKPIDMCERREVLYVKMHNHSSLSSDYFEDAIMGTLQKNDFFDRTVTRQPTVFINVEPPEMGKPLRDGRLWYDKDDPLTIGQIKKMYRENDLMILEVRLQEFSKSEPISITANLIDGYTGTTVLIWRSQRNVWYRAEHMQAKRMMHEFNDWLDDLEDLCEEGVDA